MNDRRRGGQQTSNDLAALLARIDGSGYGRYKGAAGVWSFPRFTLEIERVQSDPYAPPTRVEVRVPAAVADIPADLWATPVRRRALADYLARMADRALRGSSFRVDAGGQEVLDRSACRVADGEVTLRLGINLPAHGRRIDGKLARTLLCDQLPEAVDRSLLWDALEPADAYAFVECVEDTDALRRSLGGRGLVAFVGELSLLRSYL